VIGDEPGNTREDPGLQRKLDGKAKGEPDYRFDLLDDKTYREDLRARAYGRAKAKGGAPGVDGQSFAGIEVERRVKLPQRPRVVTNGNVDDDGAPACWFGVLNFEIVHQ